MVVNKTAIGRWLVFSVPITLAACLSEPTLSKYHSNFVNEFGYGETNEFNVSCKDIVHDKGAIMRIAAMKAVGYLENSDEEFPLVDQEIVDFFSRNSNLVSIKTGAIDETKYVILGYSDPRGDIEGTWEGVDVVLENCKWTLLDFSRWRAPDYW